MHRNWQTIVLEMIHPITGDAGMRASKQCVAPNHLSFGKLSLYLIKLSIFRELNANPLGTFNAGEKLWKYLMIISGVSWHLQPILVALWMDDTEI